VTLIPISHARALRSGAEAAALFRALGEKTVTLRGFHTRDPARIERVVGAIATKHDHTVSFEGGAIAASSEQLRLLALSRAYDYLDVRTRLANLRIWPARHSWVTSDGPTFETTSIAAAVEHFHATAGEPHERGFVMRMRDEAKVPVARFAIALGAQINATFEAGLEVAVALTELYAGEQLEWGGRDMMFVRFPAGEIAGYLKTPKVDDKHRAKWQARIDKALRKL